MNNQSTVPSGRKLCKQKRLQQIDHFESINENMFAPNGIQISLNMLSKVMMNNYLALDFFLASHGGVCTTANTLCCFGPMKQVRGITDSTLPQGKRHPKVVSHAPWGLFSWPELGSWGYCFQSILQGMLFVLCVCLCVTQRERGHGAGLMILFQNLKFSMQLLSCPTITMMTQQQKRSRRSLNIVDQGEM